MKTVEQILARYLLSQSQKHTKAEVLERYAISYNTLRKIEAGLPLRLTLVHRLEDRLRTELAQRHDEPDSRAQQTEAGRAGTVRATWQGASAAAPRRDAAHIPSSSKPVASVQLVARSGASS